MPTYNRLRGIDSKVINIGLGILSTHLSRLESNRKEGEFKVKRGFGGTDRMGSLAGRSYKHRFLTRI